MHRDFYLRKYEELRKKAESRLAVEGKPADIAPAHDVESLRHEVSVQHIELEMQHDELIKVHHELGEQRLQAEHESARYRNIFNSTAAGILILSDKGVISECNTAFACMAEQAASDLSGRTLAEFVAQDDRLNFDVLFKQETRHPSGRRIAIRIAGKQGKITPIALTVGSLDHDPLKSEAYIVTLAETHP